MILPSYKTYSGIGSISVNLSTDVNASVPQLSLEHLQVIISDLSAYSASAFDQHGAHSTAVGGQTRTNLGHQH